MTSRSTASKVMREIEELEMMKSQTHLKFLDKKTQIPSVESEAVILL